MTTATTATTAKEHPPAMERAGEREFQMPPISVGESVLWYSDGYANSQEGAAAAIVTAVGERTVSLAILGKDAFSLRPEDGVRHVSDPGLSVQEERSRGGWDYSTEHLRMLSQLNGLKHQVAAQERTLLKLEADLQKRK